MNKTKKERAALRVGYRVAEEIESLLLNDWDQDKAAKLIAAHVPSADAELHDHLEQCEAVERKRQEICEAKCKIRGDGTCPCYCTGSCSVVEEHRRTLDRRKAMLSRLTSGTALLERELKRVSTPKATVKPGWRLPPLEGDLTPTAHSTGDGWVWGWEDLDGEFWCEDDSPHYGIEWPFVEDYVYTDDWERAGFQVV